MFLDVALSLRPTNAGSVMMVVIPKESREMKLRLGSFSLMTEKFEIGFQN
jgi:hypothetical protein